MTRRYDIYRNIHKCLRRELAQLLVDVGTADETSPRDLEEVASRWQILRQLLDGHHHHEDAHLGPPLAKIAPSLFADMERDHHALEAELDALSVAAARLASAVDAASALHAFYLDLAGFVGRYVVHMDAEERSFNAALQAAFTDAEIAGIDAAILAGIEPGLMAMYLARMMAAMNPSERAALLAELRANAPPPVFEALCEVTRGALSPQAWTALRTRVLGPAPAAVVAEVARV